MSINIPEAQAVFLPMVSNKSVSLSHHRSPLSTCSYWFSPFLFLMDLFLVFSSLLMTFISPPGLVYHILPWKHGNICLMEQNNFSFTLFLLQKCTV